MSWASSNTLSMSTADIVIAGFQAGGMAPAGTFVVMDLGYGAAGGAARQVGVDGTTEPARALIGTVIGTGTSAGIYT
jgi:hypothetical protein